MRTKLALSLMMALSMMATRAAAQDAEPAVADPQAPVEGDSAMAPADAAPADAETVPAIALAEPDPAPVPAEEAPEGRNRLTEEIVVTAQKREENILDVPISITAFSGDALDAKGIGDPKTLAQSIPGVTYGETVNFSIIYVRGVGTDAFLPDSDLSVAMYLDGIYFPFANGLSQALGAIERVEVLKGPQGTLFGRNATGGAFNIRSGERRVGKECRRLCRSRWSPYH
jgi:iron complex outermembrane receptor protein